MLVALGRATLFVALTAALMPVQLIGLALGRPYVATLPVFYHRLVARILGFQVVVTGTRTAVTPALYVVNHASYLDIVVLSSVLPASFVAKSEVAGWPLFGWLARAQRTVFIDRRRSAAADHRHGIAARLGAGDNLILFPEGTSSDGNRTLPFKTALFSVADIEVGGRALTIQPVSVAYVALDGIPVGRTFRPLYAWYGDMTLAGHLWQVLKLGRTTVRVHFHDAVDITRAGTRKALARLCETAVADGVSALIGGRPLPVAAAAVPPAELAET